MKNKKLLKKQIVPHCPVCDKVVHVETTKSMPFCGERCRTIDLGRWLTEDYGVPFEGEEDCELFEQES